MMSYLNKIIPVICLLILSACGSQKSSDYDIQGLWSLYIMEVKDAESGEWKEWKNGPMTEPSDIRPAQKELMNYVIKWMKKNIK